MEDIRTLNNNQVGKFILRIDVDRKNPVDFEYVVDSLQAEYTSRKIEIHEHIAINIDEQRNKGNLAKTHFPTFVFSNDDGVTLKLNTFENTIVIESNKYRDNTVYKEKIAKVIKLIEEKHGEEIFSSRIGMRFVNRFPCESVKDISKIFNNSDSRSIKDGLAKPNVSRVLLVTELNVGEHQIRIQYGVPNKFYPARITRPDLMLDIDVYSVGLQKINEWNSIIEEENHEAYSIFVEYTKETYREKLR